MARIDAATLASADDRAHDPASEGDDEARASDDNRAQEVRTIDVIADDAQVLATEMSAVALAARARRRLSVTKIVVVGRSSCLKRQKSTAYTMAAFKTFKHSAPSLRYVN